MVAYCMQWHTVCCILCAMAYCMHWLYFCRRYCSLDVFRALTMSCCVGKLIDWFLIFTAHFSITASAQILCKLVLIVMWCIVACNVSFIVRNLFMWGPLSPLCIKRWHVIMMISWITRFPRFACWAAPTHSISDLIKSRYCAHQLLCFIDEWMNFLKFVTSKIVFHMFADQRRFIINSIFVCYIQSL